MDFNFNDKNYDKYAAKQELEVLNAMRTTNGNKQAAADLLLISRSTVRTQLKRIRNKAIKSGYIPENGMVEPFHTSLKFAGGKVHVKDGEVIQYWPKIVPDNDIEVIQNIIGEFVRDLDPLPVKKFKQKKLNKDIIPWFQIGDAHIGMLAHELEVGHNFDLKIAEREICLAIKLLVDQSPDCERCVINDLGDFTHAENWSATTEASGHALDVDTRFHKMVFVAARIYRALIEICLEKFRYVDLIINQGNHSRTNDIHAQVWLTMLYEKNPRVNIMNNSSVYIPYRMGNTFVMTHHSDKCKPTKLADVMATDYQHDHGETKYHYIDIGHIHHKTVAKELGNCIVESFNQLAPADKFANDGGWRSRSFLNVIYRSKTYGEKGRSTVTAEEVKDIIDKVPAGTNANKRREVYTV